MQSGGRSASGPRAVYYRRRPDSDEAPEDGSARRPSDESEEGTQEAVTEEAEQQQQHAAVAAAREPPRWVQQLQDAASSAAGKLRSQPAVPAGIAAATALGAVALLLASRRRGGDSKRGGGSSSARLAAHGSSSAAAAAAPSKPGPNSKLKPTASCAPTPDGHAVVVRRPIAADNSCLFNAVGYAMHHSTNRAPFLRQVVSREVSSDPQEYSDAFLGMPNAEYCAWIINPSHWGGGIELAILAAHYRREIAAWNLATGACHVFGEERGYTKRVMVIYNGAHYDVLAVSPSPRSPQEDDVTEFNPRTRRGKQIHAAAHTLVQLNRKGAGTPSHEEKQQAEKQQAKKAKAAAARSSSGSLAAAAGSEESSGSQQPAPSNGPVSSSSPAPAAAPAGDGNLAAGAASGATVSATAALLCGICGVRLAGVAAAREHAAATGHTAFQEA